MSARPGDDRRVGASIRGGPDRLLSFFFSSRRRHTRLTCDWSSDVCSSDLRDACWPPVEELAARLEGTGKALAAILMACDLVRRSEERRVGKECRSRWSP